ncbi:A/G-specific adenine glycosylase [hydrothermal vent metagenome]|uniref:A/G-specific adenine glycosylase n=1 Tax=hydrothermal vent metagenome TaxID=652676 RepID=A0A1W1CM28_9ZZZZ
MALPGIGEYTASAVCSFGLGQNVPVVDTNIARVIKRHFALLSPKVKTLWSQAEVFVNTKSPRSHNLALMDLGSLICLPKNPKCEECPLESSCLGKAEAEIYTQTKKTVYENMELFLGVCIKDNKIALKTSTQKMYKDMLVLPSVEPLEDDFIASFKHSYTKYRLVVKLYNISQISEEVSWISIANAENAPISSLTKKALLKLKSI